MSKKYKSRTERFPRRARSLRLRETGASVSVKSYRKEVSGGSGGGDGHSHNNMSVLEKLGLDGDYITISRPAATGGRVKSKSGYSDNAGHANTADTSNNANHADNADNAKMWSGHLFPDFLDQPVRKNDHVEFASVKSPDLHGAGTFVDGLLGSGFKIWEDEKGIAHLTVDKMTVRQTLVLLELLIQKTRSIGGQLVVSAADGKIKEVSTDTDNYIIKFEQPNMFMAHDLIRCSYFTGSDLRSYWVEVLSADVNSITVAKSEFADTEPMSGDECVLMGNTEDTERQNMILISAAGDGQPRIDVLNGINSKSMSGCLRVRIGNLNGINDPAFPADKQPNGYGLYGDNVYLKGNFILASGEDVKTMFEITDNKIESVAEGLRSDFAGDKGYLSNPIFADGMSKWETDSQCTFFLVGNRWIWANGAALSYKGNMACATQDMGRSVVRIKNLFIRQKNSALNRKPQFNTNAEGLKEPVPVYLSFFYRTEKAGHLTVEFENTNKEGFIPHPTLHIEEDLQRTGDAYKQYSCTGLWNGTGDFKLSYTGDIYLYMLILTTDRVDSLTYKYKSLFSQSSNLAKLAVAIYDKDEELLRETGLMVKPEGSGIYMQTADGKLALIGVAVEEDDGEGGSKTVIKLTADNIRLEGLVTANGHFKIDSEGNAEAWNMKLHGYLNSRFIGIESSDAELQQDGSYKLKTNLFVDATQRTVKLPVSDEYEGARVLILDTPHIITRNGVFTRILTDDGSPIIGGALAQTFDDYKCEAAELWPEAGTVELALMNYTYRNEAGEPIQSGLRWILTNQSCKILRWTDSEGNEFQTNQYINNK